MLSTTWIIIILLVIIIVIVICYYAFQAYYKHKLKSASWDTLKRNHPALEKLFRKYQYDKTFFAHVDELMEVEDIDAFKTKVAEFIQVYPDFENHMKSLQLTTQDTWKRFQNHRSLAKMVFTSLKE